MARPLTRLVAAPPGGDAAVREWPAAAAELIAHRPSADPARPWRPYLVHGGPGTGKTSLLVDVAAARLLDPAVDPQSVLVIAASRTAANGVRRELTRRVLSGTSRLGARASSALGGASREPLVRTVHSYAFAILRLQASAHGNPPPRLITGSEQDVVLRELLAGDVADGAAYWPEPLRPALATAGFAQSLRDLLMRAAERGLGPEDLALLGRQHGRPEWIAAAQAYRQYEQTTLLRGSVGVESPEAACAAVDAAELVGSALSAFAVEPELLARQRAGIRHLLIDDAQHLDPQAARLLQQVGIGADSVVVAADTDQSVFSFRGASPGFVESIADRGGARDIVLEAGHRSSAAVAAVGAAVAARLPGARPHPFPQPTADGGRASVRVFASDAKEATAIADELRRAHLFDGVPWSEMAVIVRSVRRMLPALRRAFSSAGVPMLTPVSDLPLAQQRAVEAFLLVLRGLTAPLTADDVVTLFSGPIGAADPGTLRRLRRGVRRVDEPDSGETDSLASLAAALADSGRAAHYLAGLSEMERAPLERVLKVTTAARRAHDAAAGVEETLWAAWQASGLERTWTYRSLRGGRAGDQADRDLDAVLALLEAAATFTDTLPAAGPSGFVDYVGQLQIPRESRVPTAGAEAVAVVSAHAAVGREWEVVAVAGVLDGLWPSLRSRGSVLGTAALVDLLDGIDPDALDSLSRSAITLADERRLLLVACTRARSALLVTAVEDGGGDASPSRFVPEIADALGGYGTGERLPGEADEIPLDPGVRRVLALPSLVATLRAELVAGAREPGERTRAAAGLLAELAAADVPGADPAQWYGLSGPSTAEPLWLPEQGARVLTPSTVEALSRCSLRWLLERHGGRDGDGEPALTGTLVHTLVQAVAGEMPADEVTAALRDIWDRVDNQARWFSARELARAEGMLTNFRDWLRMSRDELDVAGVEVEVAADLPPAAGDGPPGEGEDLPVRLVGRIDRLERDGAGRPVIIDVKTGKTVLTVEDAKQHPQLAAYQLALLLGGVDGVPAGSGGARLVYVNSSNNRTGAAQRSQDPLTPEQVDEWIGVVRKAARASVGPVFTATPNPGCGHCALTASCPAQLRGKAVTDD